MQTHSHEIWKEEVLSSGFTEIGSHRPGVCDLSRAAMAEVLMPSAR